MRVTLSLLGLLAVPAVAAAQDYHFTREIPAGGRVELDNINGAIEVTPATGRTVEVTVTKTVRRGDGSLVKAIIEGSGDAMRVCTVYLDEAGDTRTCDHDSNNGSRHGDRSQVDMHYVAHVPAGVRLIVDNVNGDVQVSGVDAKAQIEDVNGGVIFEGASASSIETTNGPIRARFTRATWEGEMHVGTVNGSVDLTFPADLNADVHGETVNGSIESTFPVTIQGKWGPKSVDGRIGTGGSRLTIETVNGGITIRRP